MFVKTLLKSWKQKWSEQIGREDSGSQLVTRLVFGDKPDSQAERTRYSSSSSSSSSSLFWLLLLSSTSSAEPIYSSSTCHGSRHLQRDHTWLHITDSCLVTETKTTESVLLTKTYLDVVSKGKGNIVITYIKILKKTWRKYNQQQENQLTLKVYSLTYRLLPPLRVIK